MAQNYEVVIFGHGDAHDINETAEALDPKMQMIQRPCFGRESTLLTKDGRYVKDLSYMNRPIKDIVFVDFTDEDVEQKPNCIVLPKFDGDVDDRALMDIAPFLVRKYTILINPIC